MSEPRQCPTCGEAPKVGSFPLMDGRTGWTCLCRCHETGAWLDREGAIAEWDAWVDSDGYEDDGDGW